MAYELSRMAKRDLVRMHEEGTARFGGRQATKYLNDFQVFLARLEQFPGFGTERAYGAVMARMAVFGSHLVIYRPHRGGIAILRILHGRQRRPGALS